MTNEQRKQAAQKAVATYRYQLLATCSFPQVIQLIEEIRKAEFSFEDDFSRDGFIAKNIGPTTFKSFCRFGDRKSVTPGLILTWIKKDGLSLDEQAMHMSNDYGHEILPDELASFIQQYDRGVHLFGPVAQIEQLKRTFKEICGFNYDYRWIKQHLIDVEHVDNLPF